MRKASPVSHTTRASVFYASRTPVVSQDRISQLSRIRRQMVASLATTSAPLFKPTTPKSNPAKYRAGKLAVMALAAKTAPGEAYPSLRQTWKSTSRMRQQFLSGFNKHR